MHRSKYNYNIKKMEYEDTEAVPVPLRKKGINRGVLTQKEKLDIVYEAIVN